MIPSGTDTKLEYVGNDSLASFPVSFPTYEATSVIAGILDTVTEGAEEVPLVLCVS